MNGHRHPLPLPKRAQMAFMLPLAIVMAFRTSIYIPLISTHPAHLKRTATGSPPSRAPTLTRRCKGVNCNTPTRRRCTLKSNALSRSQFNGFTVLRFHSSTVPQLRQLSGIMVATPLISLSAVPGATYHNPLDYLIHVWAEKWCQLFPSLCHVLYTLLVILTISDQKYNSALCSRSNVRDTPFIPWY